MITAIFFFLKQQNQVHRLVEMKGNSPNSQQSLYMGGRMKTKA